MKKKVIIYGLRGSREEVERSLSNEYEITGYSDSDILYQNIKQYECKPFILPLELKKADFDYIIITVQNKDISETIVNSLKSLGISIKKIIETCHIFNSVYSFDIPLFRVAHINQAFEGLCFGMSYSKNSFLTHFFSKTFFKISHFGSDIYYNYKNIRYIIEHNPDVIKNLKYIVFDLPYYSFNWDLSKAKRTIRSRLALLESFEDYHNYGKSESEKWYIQEYKILKNMFRHSYSYNESSFSNNFEKRTFNDFKQSNDPFATLEHVWTSYREDTIKENIFLLKNIFDDILKMNSEIKIGLVVFPMYQEHLNKFNIEIDKMANLYYEILEDHFKDYTLNVFDCFEQLQDKKLYFDTHHLNSLGGYLFSEFLDLNFKENFY